MKNRFANATAAVADCFGRVSVERVRLLFYYFNIIKILIK